MPAVTDKKTSKPPAFLTIGQASSPKGTPEPGDQQQVDVPDLGKGEVSLSRYTNIDNFYATGRKNKWQILRIKDRDKAAAAAKNMIVACNNANWGYKMGGSGTAVKGGGHYVDTTEKTVVDCSELVSECVFEAFCGQGPEALKQRGTYNSWCGDMKDKYTKNGICIWIGYVDTWETTPVYNGDILLRAEGTVGVNFSGHAMLVVNGHPREGTQDELISVGGQELSDDDTATEEVDTDGDGVPDTKKKKSKPKTLTQYVIEERDSYKLEGQFVPRRWAPMGSEGGYKYYQQSYGINQNGSYAWGRFSEIQKSECTLSRGQARKWYLYTEDGYKRGVSPSLGAVMCFTNIKSSSQPGYVCVVESIENDFIYVSCRSLDDGKFQYLKRSRKNGTWDLDLDKDGTNEFLFQGFIYNPALDSPTTAKKTYLETFIANAKEQIGLKGAEFTEKYGGVKTKNNGWSCGFVRAVAAKTGKILGTIIPDTTSCSAIGSTGVTQGMGTWLDGPNQGGKPSPQIGDLALFRSETVTKWRLKYNADKVGIVTEVTCEGAGSSATGEVKYKFKVIMGDCEGKVAEKSYTTSTKSFSGLYRPNWDTVDSIAASPTRMIASYGMYAEQATVKDAAIRDLKYVKMEVKKGKNTTTTVFKPSIKPTGIKLSAINYTGMLANLYGAFAEMSEYLDRRAGIGDEYIPEPSDSTSDEVEDDQKELPGQDAELKGNGSVLVRGRMIVADSTFKAIYSVLRNYLHNNAAAIGIMGNMVQESGLRTNAKNGAGYAGLCQWDPKSRGVKMKQHCLDYNGEPWETNLLGQLDYLKHELDTGYIGVRSTIMMVSDDLQGAYNACDTFLRKFEIPGNYDIEVPTRRAYTEGVWSLIFGNKK